MPTQASRETLGLVRTHIANRLDGIGRTEWSARFLDGPPDVNVAATLSDVETLEAAPLLEGAS